MINELYEMNCQTQECVDEAKKEIMDNKKGLKKICDIVDDEWKWKKMRE